MKILTKQWFELYEQVRVIQHLKEVETQKVSEDDLQKISREEFNKYIAEDQELAELAFNSSLAEELFKAKVERNKKAILALPQEIYFQLKNVEILCFGFAVTEDKELLNGYAKSLYGKLEEKASEAQEYLPEEFNCVVGELVFEEYIEDSDYYINIDDNILCVENFEIVERDNFEINKWDIENPVSEWTHLDAMELYQVNDGIELHLIFTNGDRLENKSRWYFTLKGTNVKFA